MSWIDKGIEDYYNWLLSRTIVTKDNSTTWHCITTPFIGLFNDSIEIYAKLEHGKLTLSDDGVTLSNLDLVGVPITRGKRKEWMDMVLLNYGIALDNNELVVKGNEKDFPQKKHQLVCAIAELNDMAVMASNTVQSVFKEDVRSYFDEQHIIYTPEFIAKGSTGIEFSFDFQIAGKNKELVIKSFNTLTKMNVPNFLFSWEDIRPTRERISGKELKGIALINDLNKEVKPEFIEALHSKGADTILWSRRNEPEEREKFVA